MDQNRNGAENDVSSTFVQNEQAMNRSIDLENSNSHNSSNATPPYVRLLTINYDETPADADVVKLPVPPGERPIKVINDASALKISAYSILRYMYAALLMYSVLASYMTGSAWYTILVFYFVEYIAFYLWHWQAHHRIWWIPFNEGCFKKHKEHHWEIYPPKDFYGARKRQINEANGSETKKDLPISTWDYIRHKTWISDHESLLILLTFFELIGARLLFHCSYSTIGWAVFGFMIMAFIGNWLHHAYHVEDHWLERFKWFHELRALHYVHHLGTAKHNYGVLNMTLDRFLGSFTFSGTKTKTG